MAFDRLKRCSPVFIFGYLSTPRLPNCFTICIHSCKPLRAHSSHTPPHTHTHMRTLLLHSSSKRRPGGIKLSLKVVSFNPKVTADGVTTTQQTHFFRGPSSPSPSVCMRRHNGTTVTPSGRLLTLQLIMVYPSQGNTHTVIHLFST